MDIQAEKITLAQLLLQTEDESIIKKVKAIFKKDQKDFTTNEIKSSVEKNKLLFEMLFDLTRPRQSLMQS